MKWRVVGLEKHDGFLNMAIDEAVCESIAAGVSPPTIRFYEWEPSAVSIGYFQCLRDEVNIDACSELGIDYVRRRTGGGAVYHDYHGEITYSVMAPEHEFPGITESYRMICGWITKSLERLGIPAEFKPINDILVNGKKISGSAQTRRGKVLLQHGTVLYDVDLSKMFSVLNVGKEKISDKMIKSAEERVTSVLKCSDVSKKELYEALVCGFTEGKEYRYGEWTPDEMNRAEVLAEERYRTKDWNFLR